MEDWYRRAERALEEDPPDWRKYFRCLRIAAKAGEPDASYDLGLWLLEGKVDSTGRPILARDAEAAVACLANAAEARHPVALHSLALCYDEGQGVPADKPRAISLYRRAVRAGSSDSAVNLAICYREVGNARRYRHWIGRAADSGSTEGILQLAEWRLQHRAPRKDVARTIWSLRALARRIRAAEDPSSFHDDDLPRAERLLRSALSRE